MKIRTTFLVVLIALQSGVFCANSAESSGSDVVKFVVECEKPNDETGHSKLLSVKVKGNENKTNTYDSRASESSINPVFVPKDEDSKPEDSVSSPVVTDSLKMKKLPSKLGSGSFPAIKPTLGNTALSERLQKLKDSIPSSSSLFERKVAPPINESAVNSESQPEENKKEDVVSSDAVANSTDVEEKPESSFGKVLSNLPTLNFTKAALSDRIQKLKDSLPSSSNLFERKVNPLTEVESSVKPDVQPKEETVASPVNSDSSPKNRPLSSVLSNLPATNAALSDKIKKLKDSLPSSSNLFERRVNPLTEVESSVNPDVKPREETVSPPVNSDSSPKNRPLSSILSNLPVTNTSLSDKIQKLKDSLPRFSSVNPDVQPKEEPVSSSIPMSRNRPISNIFQKLPAANSALTEKLQKFKDSLPSASDLVERKMRPLGGSESLATLARQPNDQTVSSPRVVNPQRNGPSSILGNRNLLSNLPGADTAPSERLQRLRDLIPSASNVYNRTLENQRDNYASASTNSRPSILDPSLNSRLLSVPLRNAGPIVSSAIPAELPGVLAGRTPLIARAIENTLLDIQAIKNNNSRPLFNNLPLPGGGNLPIANADDAIARLRGAASALRPQRIMPSPPTEPPLTNRLESIRQRLRAPQRPIVDPSYDNVASSSVVRPLIRRPLGRNIGDSSSPQYQSILSRLRNNSPNVQSSQPLTPLEKALESIRAPAPSTAGSNLFAPARPSPIRNFDPAKNTMPRNSFAKNISPLSQPTSEILRRPSIDALRESMASASSNNNPSIVKLPLVKKLDEKKKMNPFANKGANQNILDGSMKSKAPLIGSKVPERKRLSDKLGTSNIADIIHKAVPPAPGSSLPSDKLPASILDALSPKKESLKSRVPEIKEKFTTIANEAKDITKQLGTSFKSFLKNATDDIKQTMRSSNNQKQNTTRPQYEDLMVSSSNNVETCDICDCLMKYVPKEVKDGKFVMEEGNPSRSTPYETRVKFPRRLSKPNTRYNGGSEASGTNLVPTYALPPKSFNRNANFVNDENETADNSNMDRAAEIEDGINRLIEFVNIVDQVDQYISARTKNLVTRISKIYGEDSARDQLM